MAAAEGTVYFFVGPRLSALFSFAVGVVILYVVCLCEAQTYLYCIAVMLVVAVKRVAQCHVFGLSI